ncbi:MAG TPA: hypothetical protein VHR45_12085 [Thermoanaerobaculia bacterium]|nr:hypothetical protein [Thermoanaerobaculia bacterium]
MPHPLSELLSAAGRGESSPVVLVQGDLVLAEPAALKIAQAVASPAGCPVETHRRPVSLAPLLSDLRTYSLFAPVKVVLAVDTAIFADRAAAGDLIDDAADALPLANRDRPLLARERQAAARLLQALHLFALEPSAGTAEAVVAELPGWVLEGGRAARRSRGGRPRGRRQVEDLRAGLADLLAAARRDAVQGFWDSDLPDLAALIRGGLPPGHALIFAERTAAPDHPLVRLLDERRAVSEVGEVEADRGGWQGLELLAAELKAQTGAAIEPDALTELARRTLRQASDGWGGASSRGSADPDSTARFAAEYRKLATLAGGESQAEEGRDAGDWSGGRGERQIDRALVEEAVEDRGEEDVWQLLDAIAAGRGAEALDRLRRLLAAAEEPLQARLSFFGLLAAFSRQLTAIRGMMELSRVPPGEQSYNRFKTRHAPLLQAALDTGKNPLSGLHPFRLHRAYLAASRLPRQTLARLPWDVLETELQLKGESGDAGAALFRLVVKLSAPAPAPQPGRR